MKLLHAFAVSVFLFASLGVQAAVSEDHMDEEKRILLHLSLLSPEFDREFRLLVVENDPVQLTFGDSGQEASEGSLSVTAGLTGTGSIHLAFEFSGNPLDSRSEPKSFQMMVAPGEPSSMVLGESETLFIELSVVAELYSAKMPSKNHNHEECGSSLRTPCA